MKKRISSVLLMIVLIIGFTPTIPRAYNCGDDYPQEYKAHKYYSSYYNNYIENVTPFGTGKVDKWNFYTRECTSFVAWCLNSRNGIPFTNQYMGVSRWGNACYWGTVAKILGITVNKTPAIGAVAWWQSGFGHVAWVKDIQGNKIVIDEYNSPALSGMYSQRTIASTSPTGYIHFKDLGAAPKPTSPSSVTVSSENFGIGDTVKASWNSVSGADGYDVQLVCTTNSSYNQSVSVKGTSTTFILRNSGSYNISVSANNSSGKSLAKSSSTFTVHPDITVKFTDYDGSLLCEQIVKYNGNAKAPQAPSRTGYTFQGWDKSLTGLKSNITVSALYSINTYTVKFLGYNGNVLSTQRIAYGQSAIVPTTFDTPSGYCFVGWDSDSYKQVSSDLTINAVFAWENFDLPVVLSLNNAVRNTDASGYDVSLSLKNNPQNLTRGRVIATLKTETGKMVASETVSFSLVAGETKSESVFISYSGVATFVDVSVVGIVDDDNTGVPLAEAVSKEIDLGLEWSDWSTNTPPDGDYITESRIEYRYKDKSTTSSSASSLSGWTRYDSAQTGWGGWSSWQNTLISSSNSRQVETRTIAATYETRYTYDRSVNNAGTLSSYSIGYYPNYQKIDLNYRLSALGTQSGHTHYGPYVGNYGTYLKNFWWNESTYQKQLTPAYKQYRYRDATYTYYYYKWGDWSSWSSTPVSSSSNRQVETRTTYRFKSNDIKLTSYNYKRYKYLNLNDGTYYYSYDSVYPDSMGFPGEWEYNKTYTELSKISTVDNNIILYNGYGEDSWYSAEVNTKGNVTQYITYDTLEDTSGNTYTVSGQLNSPNKKATLMVYKGTNTDPTASQLEYVEQITLDSNGSYSFSFNPREVPSVTSGDFIVMLGVEGGTKPIYIDTIYAPKPTHKIQFADEAGNILSEQFVIDGENAVLPESAPKKEGYIFIGWDTSITNIRSDLTILPLYIKKDFSVVFVDWDNNDIEIKTFHYGDVLDPPEPNTKPGSTFIGWDAIIDGTTTVTDNMVVCAQYEINKYTINFTDWNGEIIATKTVEYGQEVTPPENPQMDDMVFMGWTNPQALLFAYEDITVNPIFGYAETTEIPTASHKTATYSGKQTVSLSCSTPNSKIYYYAGNDIDTKAAEQGFLSLENLEFTQYSTPLEISDNTTVIFYAASDNMNNSDYIIENYTIIGNYNIEITGSSLKNTDGTISGKIYYNVIGSGNSAKAALITAVYNSKGKLLFIKYGDSTTWNDGDNIGNVSDISFTHDSSESYNVKLFLWYSTNSLKPISNHSEIIYN